MLGTFFDPHPPCETPDQNQGSPNLGDVSNWVCLFYKSPKWVVILLGVRLSGEDADQYRAERPRKCRQGAGFPVESSCFISS